MPGRDSTRILEAEACKYFLIVSESMRDKFEGHVGPCFWAKYEWYVTMLCDNAWEWAKLV